MLQKAASSNAKHDVSILLCQNHGLLRFFEAHVVCTNNGLPAKYFAKAVTIDACGLHSVHPVSAWLTWLCYKSQLGLFVNSSDGITFIYPKVMVELPCENSCFPRET